MAGQVGVRSVMPIAVAGFAALGCRYSLESAAPDSVCRISTAQICMQAEARRDLAWIERNIFETSCNFSGCHKGPNDAGHLDLRAGESHRSLVNVVSKIDTTRRLVVPNDVDSSYLMLMIGAVAPEVATPPGVLPDAGLMPQSSPEPLCCQKLEALERWINSGAQNH